MPQLPILDRGELLLEVVTSLVSILVKVRKVNVGGVAYAARCATLDGWRDVVVETKGVLLLNGLCGQGHLTTDKVSLEFSFSSSAHAGA